MERILIVDDDQDICLLLKKFLSKNGYDVTTASTGEEAVAALKKQPADLVLCDFKLPDYTGVEILQKIKIIHPAAQVIIITGYSDVRVAVEALKMGAYEYVTKPLYPDEILLTVKQALSTPVESKPSRKQAKPAKPSSPAQPTREFVEGESPQAKAVKSHIGLIAPTDMSVIILGETGTGKEYVARAIHEQSKRAEAPFVAVDCGALPKDLAGSELFGHVKGAFTGAITDKKGCFELANGGTLFLDEIGNLSYDNQVKLLRVLQERVVKPIGGTKTVPVDVRVLVATNENLLSAVRSGEFREDIYHRLNEFKIELEPLRQRPEDVAVFAQHFLGESNAQLNKEVQGFDEEAMKIMQQYYWHGNLRELRNVVKRAVLLCQGDTIAANALPVEIVHPAPEDQGDVMEVLFNGAVNMSLKEVAERAEKKAIVEVLRKTNHNKTKTAELLEVDRKTLYNKMKAYGISE